jgi:predicted O-methyltransferase YrrM
LGTSNGYSALWQALAFKETNGMLMTVEIDTMVALEAQKNFNKAGLDKFIDSRTNDASVEVLALKDSLDFVFIDTGPKNLDYLNISYPMVGKGGILVVHNVHKNDDQLKRILSNPDLKATLKSRFFYNILICEKKL